MLSSNSKDFVISVSSHQLIFFTKVKQNIQNVQQLVSDNIELV